MQISWSLWASASYTTNLYQQPLSPVLVLVNIWVWTQPFPSCVTKRLWDIPWLGSKKGSKSRFINFLIKFSHDHETFPLPLEKWEGECPPVKNCDSLCTICNKMPCKRIQSYHYISPDSANHLPSLPYTEEFTCRASARPCSSLELKFSLNAFWCFVT